MAKPTREFRATRIVATIGPKAEQEGLLGRLLAAGVDVVRLNGAHCRPGDIARRVALVREAQKQLGRPVGVLLDLGGPKIRVGPIEGDATSWREGDLVEIVPGHRTGSGRRISVTYPALLAEVRPGAEIRIADGLIRLKVEKREAGSLRARVLAGGTVRKGAGVNFPSSALSAPAVTAPAPGRDEVLTHALHLARLGDTARTVFSGSETIGHVGAGRVVVLADRDDRIGRRVGLLRRMLDDARARVWIEGLPGSDEAAGRLLDELTRA